jgi:Tfp pilus assembly protein PilF
LLLSLLLCAAPVLAGPVNPEAKKLIDAGNAYYAQGKLREAMDALDQAVQADPAASLPLAMKAGMIYKLSLAATAENRGVMRTEAQKVARQAIAIDPQDPVALEVLRVMSENPAAPAHTANAEALRLMNAGEVEFGQKHYAQALALYEQAAAADPQTATPWIYAGDCFYAQQQYAQAETRFRKAAAIEPLSTQAWRYLADALAQQGKTNQAEDALFSGIAAQPSQQVVWDKLAGMMARAGTPLKRLNFRMMAKIRRDAAGKPGIELNEAVTKQTDTADSAFWLSFAMLQIQNTKPGFAGDLDTLRQALRIDADLVAKGSAKPFGDPALATLRQLAARDQLEPAMLLLMYREAYRPALESWKQAHPNGVRDFVVATGLRP